MCERESVGGERETRKAREREWGLGTVLRGRGVCETTVGALLLNEQ